MKSLIAFSTMVLAAMTLIGCSTVPPSSNDRAQLQDSANSATTRLESLDPSLKGFIDKAYAYAVFPSIGNGAVIVGGAGGRGVVYTNGMTGGTLVGYATMSQATIGAQLGGQTFSEIICFQDQNALSKFQNNQTAFTASASAVALESGAGDAAKYADGTVVFIEPKAGLMASAAVGGQQFTYEPAPAGN
jgi:lipid-binding SYLF domain-containing protein